MSESFERNLLDQHWRLNNLYTIVNKDKKQVPFRPNWAQSHFFDNVRLRNLVLKVRQLGMSTGIDILALDMCLFYPNYESVIIAHERDALEKMFISKVKDVYDRLPESLRSNVPATRDRTHSLRFSNGSEISVALSSRSSTPSFLHISEFGKICYRYPDKAEEIVTGAIESVPSNGIVAIESTAEGNYGHFYNYCMDAMQRQESGHPAAPSDYHLFFYPWYKHTEYVEDPRHVIVTAKQHQYFDQLEIDLDITLSPARRAWYAGKERKLGPKVKSEYPSTPEEAFEQSLVGAYYADEMKSIRQRGQICEVPHQRGVLVDTWWDLGIDDHMVIWFHQRVGREHHLIDYISGTDSGLAVYIQELRERQVTHGYMYGNHIAPHDIEVRELGTGVSRWETAKGLGVEFTTCERHDIADGIDSVRNFLPNCWFDRVKTEEGYKALESYRKEWDDRRGVFRSKPEHNAASHPSDAFRTGVMGQPGLRSVVARPNVPGPKWGF